jgi:hypothetical protein
MKREDIEKVLRVKIQILPVERIMYERKDREND